MSWPVPTQEPNGWDPSQFCVYGRKLLAASSEVVDRRLLLRPVLLTQPEPYELLKAEFPDSTQVHLVTEIEHSAAKQRADGFRQGSPTCVVGLGGGLALDYAKFTAWRLKLPLILMPSILSVDAGYTRASGVREQGAVSYVGSIEDHLQHILIDYDVLQSAPALLNSAGAGDILSCFTALYDWKLSADTIAEPYNEDIAKTVQSECLERLYQGAQELAQQTPTGLRLLSELFVAEVRLCEQWGNARPEEGSEHFLGYALEARTKKHYVHGQLIGMCTLIVGAYQGQDVSPVVDCLKALSLDCSFDVLVHFIGCCLFNVQAVGTTRQEMREVLQQVGDYVKAESHLFPGIFHFKGNVPESQVDSLLDIIDSNFPSA